MAKSRRTLVTRVEHVMASARREEIARMLAGAQVTKEARAAAERLMGGGLNALSGDAKA